MEKTTLPPGRAPGHYGLTTGEFAAQQLVLAQTVRKQYSATGSYFGAVPLRLPNRRLLWPCDAVEKMLVAQQLVRGSHE